MRFMMMMIPRVYQPDAPPGEKAGEGFSPPAEAVAKMMKFNEELAKEVVGGYWMIEAKSKEEAVGWARRCPASDGDVIEVRQVFEMSDFPLDVREAADNSTVHAQVEKRKAS